MKWLLAVVAVLALFVAMPPSAIAEGPSVQASFSMPPQDPFSMPLNVGPLNWQRQWPINIWRPQERPVFGTSSAEPVEYTGIPMSAGITVSKNGLRFVFDWGRSRIASAHVNSTTLYQPHIEPLNCFTEPCPPHRRVQRFDDMKTSHRVLQNAFSLGMSCDTLKNTKRFTVAPGIGVQLWSVSVTQNQEYTKSQSVSPLMGQGQTLLEILQHDTKRDKRTLSRVQSFISLDTQYWPRGKHHGVGLVTHVRYVMGSMTQHQTASSLTDTYDVPVRQEHWQGRAGLAIAF